MSETEKNVDRLAFKGSEIILVGTAHVSKESVALVRKTIEEEKPDIVGIELCEKRHETLADRRKWESTKITDIIREGKTPLFLANILLATYQRKIGDKLGIKPGSEMIEAMNIAKEKDIAVALIDRDIQVTLNRAWSSMGILEKFKLGFLSLYDIIFGIFLSDEVEESLDKQIERLKDKDAVSEMLKELSRLAPSMKRSLIDERDAYIAHKIIDALGNENNKKLVAVLGAGHVTGVKKEIEKNMSRRIVDIKKETRNLEEMPKRRNILSYIKWAVPIIVICVFAWAYFTGGVDLLLKYIVIWFIANGIPAGIGAALARAHPVAIMSAVLAAPFTSLNPLLAAGLVAGFVEALIRKPLVLDFENLNNLKRIRDLWGNRVTRIFLVVIFANAGSSIGTLVIFPILIGLLGS